MACTCPEDPINETEHCRECLEEFNDRYEHEVES